MSDLTDHIDGLVQSIHRDLQALPLSSGCPDHPAKLATWGLGGMSGEPQYSARIEWCTCPKARPERSAAIDLVETLAETVGIGLYAVEYGMYGGDGEGGGVSYALASDMPDRVRDATRPGYREPWQS